MPKFENDMREGPKCLLCTRILCKWLCESDLTCLHCKRIESDPYLIHHWSSSLPGLGRCIMMCNLEICFRSCGPIIMFRARLTNQYEMNYWNVNWNDRNHIGPGRELSATCGGHLWNHGGSQYFCTGATSGSTTGPSTFAWEPPLEPSSRSWSGAKCYVRRPPLGPRRV